jgi:cobalt-zinc-cadmium efflux system membrane fusion protein
MFAQLRIEAPARRALSVPRRAVSTIGGAAFASVASGTRGDGRLVFKRRRLQVAEPGADLLEVTGGVAAGESVLVDAAELVTTAGEQVAVGDKQLASIGLQSIVMEAQDATDAVVLGGRLSFEDLHVAHVFSPVNGRVTRVVVRLGQQVRRGEPLAALESPDFAQAAADALKARADLVLADHERTRQRELYEAHGSARRDLEAAEATWLKARAELDRAEQRTQLLRGGAGGDVTQEYLLTSPIDGEVVARNISPGLEVQGQYSGAAAALELFTIGRTDRLQVLADAYEVDLPRLRAGDPITLQTPTYQGRAFKGVIEGVSGALDPQLRTAKVRCSVENPDRLLRAEMYAPVTIQVAGQKVLAVPRTALLRVGEATMVFVDRGAQDGKRVFERRQVVADEGRSGGMVAVSAGLSPGERVVSKGAVFLLGLL